LLKNYAKITIFLKKAKKQRLFLLFFMFLFGNTLGCFAFLHNLLLFFRNDMVEITIFSYYNMVTIE